MDVSPHVLLQLSPYLVFFGEDQHGILVDQKRDLPTDQHGTTGTAVDGPTEEHVLLN